MTIAWAIWWANGMAPAAYELAINNPGLGTLRQVGVCGERDDVVVVKRFGLMSWPCL